MYEEAGNNTITRKLGIPIAKVLASNDIEVMYFNDLNDCEYAKMALSLNDTDRKFLFEINSESPEMFIDNFVAFNQSLDITTLVSLCMQMYENNLTGHAIEIKKTLDKVADELKALKGELN